MPAPGKQLSRLALHIRRWSECTACILCERRKNVVLGRGEVPCDVLFIGEAPGHSEDVVGGAFEGPAGRLLDRLIDRAMPPGQSLRIAFTNLVCCIPLDDDGNKTHTPTAESVVACTPRLVEFVGLAAPVLIVCIGDPAWRWVPKALSRPADKLIKLAHIVHPSAILQAPEAQQGLLVREAIMALTSAIETIPQRI